MVGLRGLATRYGVDLKSSPLCERFLRNLMGGYVPSFLSDLSSYDEFLVDVLHRDENGPLREYLRELTLGVITNAMPPARREKIMDSGVGEYAREVLRLLYLMYRDGVIDDVSGSLYVYGGDDMAVGDSKDAEFGEGARVYIHSFPPAGDALHDNDFEEFLESNPGYRHAVIEGTPFYDDNKRKNIYSVSIYIEDDKWEEYLASIDESKRAMIAPFRDEDGYWTNSLYEDNLREDQPEDYRYEIGTRVRVRESDELGPGQLIIQSLGHGKYRGMTGTIVGRELRWPDDDALDDAFDELGLERLGYDVDLYDTPSLCPSCGTRLDAGADACSNPACDFHDELPNPVFFFEHEITPVSRVEEARLQRERASDLVPMPAPEDFSRAMREEVDDLVENPPDIAPIVDPHVSGKNTVALYEDRDDSGFVLVAWYEVEDFEGDGSALVDASIARYRLAMSSMDFHSTDRPTEFPILAVLNGEYQYYDSEPISVDMNHPVVWPDWRELDGIRVGLWNQLGCVPFERPDARDLPFFVSYDERTGDYLPYEAVDAGGRKWTWRVREVRFGGSLKSYEDDLDRKYGVVSADVRTDYYGWVRGSLVIEDEGGDEVWRQDDWQMLFSPRLCSYIGAFGDTCYTVGTAYIATNHLLLEGRSSLCRFDADGDYWSVLFLKDTGRPIKLRGRVSGRDFASVGPGLNMNASLPNGDRFTGRAYVMQENPGQDDAGLNCVSLRDSSGDLKVLRVPDDYDSLEVVEWATPFESGGQSNDYEIIEFVSRGGKSRRIWKKDKNFSWAISGETVVSGGSDHLPAGRFLDGLYKDVNLFARSVRLTGEDESGDVHEYVLNVSDEPGEGEFGSICVRFDASGDIVEARFGRDGYVDSVARIGEIWLGREPYIDVGRIELVEPMTFSEQSGRTVRPEGARLADETFADLSGVDEDYCEDWSEHDVSDELRDTGARYLIGADVSGLDEWAGDDPLVVGVDIPLNLGDLFGDEVFDIIVRFSDDSSLRFVDGVYSLHAPICPNKARLGFVCADVDEPFLFYEERIREGSVVRDVVNLVEVCVKGRNYDGDSVSYHFVVGDTWKPLGKKVVSVIAVVSGVTVSHDLPDIEEVPVEDFEKLIDEGEEYSDSEKLGLGAEVLYTVLYETAGEGESSFDAFEEELEDFRNTRGDSPERRAGCEVVKSFLESRPHRDILVASLADKPMSYLPPYFPILLARMYSQEVVPDYKATLVDWLKLMYSVTHGDRFDMATALEDTWNSLDPDGRETWYGHVWSRLHGRSAKANQFPVKWFKNTLEDAPDGLVDDIDKWFDRLIVRVGEKAEASGEFFEDEEVHYHR